MTSENKEYKSTVLTPKTEFPMRAGLPEREPERFAKWESMKLYERIQERRADKPLWILHDGPPYANGNIHLGHALNKTLKDVIVRYRTMKGFRAPYVPGWDCHGLPIEQQVSKKLGPKLNSMPPAEVRKLCKEYAEEWIGTQREQFKRLGILGDWDRPYLTMDPKFEVGILSALRDLVVKGLVRKGMKPVHWDPVFRTALAEAEIEYETHRSPSIFVRFPLRESEKCDSLKGLTNVSLVIWTTTPWTLPANMGVCLHPEFEYVAVRHGDQHYIVAAELAPAFIKGCDLSGAEITGVKLRGPELERGLCDHPIFPDKSSLIILGDHVTLEQGSGCVHTAPGHGMDDYIVGNRYGLEVFVPVDDGGRFSADYPEMEGEFVFDANPKIVEKLRAAGLLLGLKEIEHEYPHSWRSHKPIIFRATAQWFMELKDGAVRSRALKAIDEEVKWIPRWGRDRIYAMASQRPDWCLSRQRSWGVPIPAVRSKKSGESILDARLMDKFISVVAEKGTDAWFTEPLSAFWPEGFVHEPTGESSPDDFEKEFDILDVWFDSGASHIACLEQDDRLRSPADLYLEGSDQHRGWFQSSLLIGVGARDRAPFKAVLTHGFLLDGKGHAMSKSKGNVISPLDEIKKRGADILRLWVCSEDYRTDMKVSEEILTRTAEGYRRIRNTLRFLLGNVHDFDPAADAVPCANLEEIDRWCLSELAGVIARVDRAYDEYEFHRVYHLVHGFCNNELSAGYLDALKDRLYCSAPDDATRRAAQTVCHHLLRAVCGMIAPILTYTADEAWESAGFADDSVHLTDFPVAEPGWKDSGLDAKWDRLLKLRDEGRVAIEEQRREKVIRHSLDADVEIFPYDEADGVFLSENLALLKLLLIVSTVRTGESDHEGRKSSDGQKVHRIAVLPSGHAKCERCWMKVPDVGEDAEHPGLCRRCVEVVRRVM